MQLGCEAKSTLSFHSFLIKISAGSLRRFKPQPAWPPYTATRCRLLIAWLEDKRKDLPPAPTLTHKVEELFKWHGNCHLQGRHCTYSDAPLDLSLHSPGCAIGRQVYPIPNYWTRCLASGHPVTFATRWRHFTCDFHHMSGSCATVTQKRRGARSGPDSVFVVRSNPGTQWRIDAKAAKPSNLGRDFI